MIYTFPSNISLLQDDVMKYHKEDFVNFVKLMKLLSEKLKEKKGILCVTGSKVAAISNSKLYISYCRLSHYALCSSGH
jgi:hypothetical protein